MLELAKGEYPKLAAEKWFLVLFLFLNTVLRVKPAFSFEIISEGAR